MSGGPEVFDTVVVGAGPAGSVSAASAAKGGRRVCLLERRADVSRPIRCGEGIGLKGFDRSTGVHPEWIRATVRKVHLVSPRGITVRLRSVDQSFILDRSKMDADLVFRAVEAGVTYHPSTPVLSVARGADGVYRCAAPGREYQCRCLILADGVESRLARHLGWTTALRPEDIETCAFARVTHPSIAQDTIEMYVGRCYAPGGYVWVFPRGEGGANVGLGVLGSLHESGDAQRLLNGFIAKRFPDGEIRDLHCGGVPVGRGLRPLVRGGAMIVGDAARQVHALAGAGLAYSLIAGAMAGTAASKAFASGSFDASALNSYEKDWFSYNGKQQLRSYSLKNTIVGFGDAFLDEIAGSLAGRDPDRTSLLRLFGRTFARHPWQLLRVFMLYR